MVGVETQRQQAAIEERLFGVVPSAVRVGRFLVLEKIGRGGWGTVYAAFDEQLDRRVALKVLNVRPGDARSDELMHEAKALAKLSHPNVVTVHEVGTTVDDRVFMAMEFVSGGTLDEWAAKLEPGPARIRKVVHALLEAARGLQAAHDAGIVHRDLKPANILVGDDGRVRLADFGMAHLSADAVDTLDPEASGGDISETQAHRGTGSGWVGTPAYMAPEQFEGQSDERGDQFNLCAAFYEIVCGLRPFSGNSIGGLMLAAREGVLATPTHSDVPGWLKKVLARGLSPKPGDRFENAAALAQAVERARRPRWPFLALGLVMAAPLGLFLLVDPPTEGPDCEATADAHAPRWSEELIAEIREAFRETQLPRQANAFDGIRRTLDSWVHDWRSSRVIACQASLRQADNDAVETYDAEQCLDSLAVRFDALTPLLLEADEFIVEAGVVRSTFLPRPSACLHSGDAAARALAGASEDLARDLYRVYNLQALQKHELADASLDELMPKLSPGTGAAAMASCLGGALAFEQFRLEEALEEVTVCLEAAELGGYYWTAAEAWLLRFAVLSRQGHYEEALFAVERARSISRRPEVGVLGRARVQWRLAIANRHLSRFDEALEAIESAFADYAAHSTPDRQAKVMCDWSETLFFAGKRDEAIEKVRECRRLNLEAHGEDAIQLALPSLILSQYSQIGDDFPGALAAADEALRILSLHEHASKRQRYLAEDARAKALMKLRRFDEADDARARAGTLVEELYGPDGPHMMSHLNEVANIDNARGDRPSAIAVLQEAAGLAESGAAARDPMNAGIMYFNLAKSHAAAGHRTEALEVLERAKSLMGPLRPDDSVHSIGYHLNIAEVLSSVGDVEAAQAEVDHAFRLASALGVGPIETASVWEAQATHRLRAGDRASATSSLLAALELLDSAPDATSAAPHRERLSQWAAEHELSTGS